MRQRRDEAQGRVAAAIADERLPAREQVQEPFVERPCGVAVDVPVGGESARVLGEAPGHTRRGVIEVGAGGRIELRTPPSSR